MSGGGGDTLTSASIYKDKDSGIKRNNLMNQNMYIEEVDISSNERLSSYPLSQSNRGWNSESHQLE